LSHFDGFETDGDKGFFFWPFFAYLPKDWGGGRDQAYMIRNSVPYFYRLKTLLCQSEVLYRSLAGMEPSVRLR
jgi:hypothetical protein